MWVSSMSRRPDCAIRQIDSTKKINKICGIRKPRNPKNTTHLQERSSTSEDGSEESTDRCDLINVNISGTTNEAVRETTGSLNGSAHEGGSASACNSVVKVGLSTEDGGVGETRSIRNVLLKVDVRCEDRARARRAKCARIGGRSEEKER